MLSRLELIISLARKLPVFAGDLPSSWTGSLSRCLAIFGVDFFGSEHCLEFYIEEDWIPSSRVVRAYPKKSESNKQKEEEKRRLLGSVTAPTQALARR